MTRPGQPDTRPRARLVSESYQSGDRGWYDRHWHTTIRGDDGAEITVSRYTGGRTRAALVTPDGQRREISEPSAGSNSWYAAAFGYELAGP